MSPAHSDIWAGVGAILSSIASAYAWLYSIGLVPLFTFIAGVLFTLWTQERLEKKRQKREFDKKMTEYIYGPLHQELNSLLNDLKAFQSPADPVNRVATLNNIMKDYRYDLVKDEIRHRLEDLQKRLPPYAAILNEARRETETHIGRRLHENGISREIKFVIWAGGLEIDNTVMIEPIFRDKTPLQFLYERARPYRNTSMIVYVGPKSEGQFSKEHRYIKFL